MYLPERTKIKSPSNSIGQKTFQILATTGKSFSEALILAPVNPQYDERLSIEFQEKSPTLNIFFENFLDWSLG